MEFCKTDLISVSGYTQSLRGGMGKKVPFHFLLSSPGIILSIQRGNVLSKWPWMELKETLGTIYAIEFELS